MLVHWCPPARIHEAVAAGYGVPGTAGRSSDSQAFPVGWS